MIVKVFVLVFWFIIRVSFIKVKSIADIIRNRYGKAVVRKTFKFEKNNYKLRNGHLDLRFFYWNVRKINLFQCFYNLNERTDTSIILLFTRSARLNFWMKRSGLRAQRRIEKNYKEPFLVYVFHIFAFCF